MAKPWGLLVGCAFIGFKGLRAFPETPAAHWFMHDYVVAELHKDIGLIYTEYFRLPDLHWQSGIARPPFFRVTPDPRRNPLCKLAAGSQIQTRHSSKSSQIQATCRIHPAGRLQIDD
jgi:hypothetical protein